MERCERQSRRGTSSILRVLEAKRQGRLAAEEERKREAERQRFRAEAQRQEKEEEQRIGQLKLWTQAWRECEHLRNFVGAWERQVEAKGGKIESGTPADAWRRWALCAIDRLDPLID
jgi:hypothetical protein